MKKQVSLFGIAVLPLLLTSCGTSAVRGSNNNIYYHGYSTDLNHDGVISDDEQHLTWAQSYDVLINEIKTMAIDTSEELNERFDYMHQAEDLLMSTGAICPLYWYTDSFLIKESAQTNFFASPLGFKFLYGVSGESTACIASQPDTIDPALNSSVDGATYDSHLFEGLMRWEYTGTYPNGSIGLTNGIAQPDEGATAWTKVKDAKTGTVTYTIPLKTGLKWSDGSSYNANDIVRSWKRAVNATTGADYAYMFEIIDGGAAAESEADGASLNVKATDENTIQVTLVSDVPYFKEILAFPALMPVPDNADSAGTWATPDNYAASFKCNGPMKISAYTAGSTAGSLVMVPNTNYGGSAKVNSTKLTWAFSDDAEAMLSSYTSGAYTMIDDLPSGTAESEWKKQYPKEYYNVGQLGTYYIVFNVNDTTFNSKLTSEADREYFRKALSLLINRQYLVDSVTQGGQTPANGFVSSGLLNPDGKTEYIASNGSKHDGKGYYSTSSDDFSANQAKGY
jgi:oligopeptide transport system substrate-binding protein